MPRDDGRLHRSLRRHLALALASCALVFGGAAALSASIRMSGAVVAGGHLVVESELKKVQHPTGGVVAELLVDNGAHVAAGEALLRLDRTVADATLTAVTRELWELAARRARLEAERAGAAEPAFPPDLLDAARADLAVAHIVSGERKLFHFRIAASGGEKSQLRERIGQLKLEIEGLQGQIKAKASEIELVGKELDGVRSLWEKNLVQLTRLTALERDAARLRGEAGKLDATLAQTRGKVTETELQILQIDQSMRSDTSKELAEIRSKSSELVEKKVASIDQLMRIELKAPQAGVVHQLSVHTKGGVIAPGEQVMMIVPESDELAVEARILPKDIDQVRLGQKAVLRFTSFNQRATPEIAGEVARVAADVTEDDRTDQPYYLVRVKILSRSDLGDVTLTPGMPVEAFIQTGDRTMLSYLTKPLWDQSRHAFRER